MAEKRLPRYSRRTVFAKRMQLAFGRRIVSSRIGSWLARIQFKSGAGRLSPPKPVALDGKVSVAAVTKRQRGSQPMLCRKTMLGLEISRSDRQTASSAFVDHPIVIA